MNKYFAVICIVSPALAILGCSPSSREKPTETSAEKPVAPESRVQHGTNGATSIQLDAATQKTMGLEITSLAAAELASELKCFGRVVDPAPLAEMLMELGKAQLVFDNSHQELERMKVLKQENNASERALQTAELTYRQNSSEVSAIWFKLQKHFGSRIAALTGPLVLPPGTQRKPGLLEEIADARGVFLIRVDVPVAETLNFAPTGARIVGLAEGALPVPTSYFGEAPAVDPLTQARGYFFLATTNQPQLIPGMAVTAFIQTEAQAQSGVVVPRNAVVRCNGATWIYLQTGDETWQRVEVKLDRPLAAGWFVREKLKPQDRVVTVGAQQLLSEELLGQSSGD